MLVTSSSFRLWLLVAFAGFAGARAFADAPNSPRFVIKTVGDATSEQTKKVSDALEGSYERIAADLRTAPASPFAVQIYASRWSYIRATGNWGASGSIEGVDKLHLIPVAGVAGDYDTVAVHEFTHAVTLKLLLDHEPKPVDNAAFDRKCKGFPVWLWEAIAAYESKHLISPKKLGFISKTSYPSLEELSDRSKGGKVYKIGYTLIEYILAEHGQDGLIDLILAYGDLGVLKTNPGEFSQRWHQFVVKKYLE